MELKTTALFDNLDKTVAGDFLSAFEYPWECLTALPDFIAALGKGLPADIYEEIGENVWAAKSARIAGGVTLTGPAVIGENAVLRPSAFVRGGVLVGNGCVVGNSTELKNCILFDGVQVPHFNYVGDSVIGYRSHFGAGAVTGNVKGDKTPVTIKNGEVTLPTGRKKVGAFLGSFVEVGCHCVMNPGTVIGRNTRIYPLSCVRGCVPPDRIYKNKNNIVKIQENEGEEFL